MKRERCHWDIFDIFLFFVADLGTESCWMPEFFAQVISNGISKVPSSLSVQNSGPANKNTKFANNLLGIFPGKSLFVFIPVVFERFSLTKGSTRNSF